MSDAAGAAGAEGRNADGVGGKVRSLSRTGTAEAGGAGDPAPRQEEEVEVGKKRGKGEAVDSAKASSVRAVLLHQVATTGLSLVTLQPRTQLLSQCLSGEELAAQINASASLVAGLEFLLSPSMGVLSDRIGRRPMMLAAPASGVIVRACAALRPSSPQVLTAERVVCDTGRAFAGTTMCYAALADICGTGPELVPVMARCNSAMGLGMVMAPLAASVIARRGGPRASFIVAAVLTGVQLALECRLLGETCKKDEVVDPSKRGSLNPLSFLRLFVKGARLRALAVILALQCAIDGKLLQDQISIVQMVHGRWSLERRSLWSAAFGAAIAVGGLVTKRLIFSLGGEQRFASLTHLMSVAAFLAYSKNYFWLGLIPLVVGQQRRSPTISWMMAEAEPAGVGRGEMLAMTVNLRAAVEIVFPMVYGMAQRSAARRGNPGQVFYAPAVLTLVAEAVRMWLPPRR